MMSEHVEAEVAWRMRRSGAKRVELVINNEMCRGQLSRVELLPDLLLPGQTLVVHGPRRTRVFRGRSL
ncbi:SCP1.201-like deaminase [Streptoalloteichus hindustanus]|uniref:SCP1.201-like deaminase n=1 Tax=Streptoalloteichus hindustanus TaxID=2017 RepID=A0A1M4ZGM6_STRHI|nr:SCP1.201-like deaminase [Streptoalloteichus hindustanus]